LLRRTADVKKPRPSSHSTTISALRDCSGSSLTKTRSFKRRCRSPDGKIIDASLPGAEEFVDETYRMIRVTPSIATPSAKPGRWSAILRIDEDRVDEWLRRLRDFHSKKDNDRRDGDAFERTAASIKQHGVPFTLTVQARSALRLRAEVSQTSRMPGQSGLVVATLTDSGIPLVSNAEVVAEVTSPNGTLRRVRLIPVGERYTGTIETTMSGAYQIRLIATGRDLRGTPFTREELRSLAVWARGDDPSPTVIDPKGVPGGIDPCKLLHCLLEQKGVQSILKRNEIDPAR
jgi:hypothetical protein